MQMGCGGAKKGGGSNVAELLADRRRQRDEMRHNNQPGWMRDNYTRE